MLCRSPHLFSVVTSPQENKVPFNYACTCESVPLTAAICSVNSSHNVNYKNVQAEQNHSNSQCLRKCHNLCSKCPPSADTQQRRLKQRLVASWSAMPQRVIDEDIEEWHRRLCCCVSAEGEHFEHTSYDTYIGIVNLNGFVQPVCFYHLTLWLLLTEQIHMYMHN